MRNWWRLFSLVVAARGQEYWLAVIGVTALGIYGVVPTLQTVNFGRAYAAYGGIFIALSLLWSWIVDRTVPDKFNLLGAGVALLGVAIVMYAPRN